MKYDDPKILILIGIPASGKSTWAKQYTRNNPSWVRVSRDDFRLMLKTSQVCPPNIEDLITVLVNEVITKSLMKKLNVIVDNTNLQKKYIDAIIDRFKYSADIDYRSFDISVDKAIQRDSAREMKVGEGVIKKMHKDFKNLMDCFDFQPVKRVQHRPHLVPNFNSELPDAVIFDIDGTLALMKNRGPFDWNKVDRDDPNQIVKEQVDFHRSLGRKILMVSGRDEECRAQTEDWLNFYGFHFDELFMRRAGSRLKDTYIKKGIYDSLIAQHYNVLCVYDDRLQVLEMWNDIGLFTFNVNQGQHEF